MIAIPCMSKDITELTKTNIDCMLFILRNYLTTYL